MKIKMNDSETYEFESRRYLDPTVSRDEQLDFVQTLRDTVGANTAQIAESTERLGTDIPSSMGGLTGSGSYFTQRYQTTPLETRANTLKATAQAKALNDLMSNYEKQYANRAQQAYRNAARRAKTSPSGGGGGGNSEGGVEFEESDREPSVSVEPPKEEDYYITGEEQTERIVERTGLPDWLVNILKVFGAS